MDKKEILQILQEYQLKYIDKIDIEIQTRKDQKGMQIIFEACNYKLNEDGKIDRKNRSKLYVHRFKWIDSNIDSNYKTELKVINDEIKLLKDKY